MKFPLTFFELGTGSGRNVLPEIGNHLRWQPRLGAQGQTLGRETHGPAEVSEREAGRRSQRTGEKIAKG